MKKLSILLVLCLLLSACTPAAAPEQNTPEEPFTITVNRAGTVENFTGCYLTSDIREDRMEGVNRVRSGIAEKKTYSSIL